MRVCRTRMTRLSVPVCASPRRRPGVGQFSDDDPEPGRARVNAGRLRHQQAPGRQERTDSGQGPGQRLLWSALKPYGDLVTAATPRRESCSRSLEDSARFFLRSPVFNSCFCGGFALTGMAKGQSTFDSYVTSWLEAPLNDDAYYQGTLRLLFMMTGAGLADCAQ